MTGGARRAGFGASRRPEAGGQVPPIVVHSRRPQVARSLRRSVARLAPRPRLSVRAEFGEGPGGVGHSALEIVDLSAFPPHRSPPSGRGADSRVVALVDESSAHRLIDALAGGFDDYLLFPVRLRELRLLWKRHLEGDRPCGFPAEAEDGRRILLEFPSDVRFCRSAVERVVEACVRLAGLTDDEAFRLRVALGEAVTNAVLYGNAEEPHRRVRVSAGVEPGELRVEVADEGEGFDPASVPDPTAPHNLERSHGRGLFLMRGLMDDVRFNEIGNSVTLVLRTGERPPSAGLAREEPDASGPAAPGASELAPLLDRLGHMAELSFRLAVDDGVSRRVLYDSLPGTSSEREEGAYRLERPLPGGGRLTLMCRPRRSWSGISADGASFLADWAVRLLQADRELALFSQEMVERYEEITLLTSISETLGSHIQVHEAAGVILRELSDVLGVERASLWLEEQGVLQPFASHAAETSREEPPTGAPPAAEEGALAARVFESQEPLLMDVSAGPALSVPVGYAPLEGAPLRIGVLNLIGRAGGSPFRAGDLRLMTAVASQIGAAIQNGRLVQESLRRERLMAELEIAHDIQLRMLPKLEGFMDLAEVAARCEPAESIGGDFYLLIRLSGGRLGVMLGDVSSHGISAALIMALTMSAAGIYARERERPGEVVHRIQQQLLRELESTEMYMTLFYGVLEPGGRELRYANAGHPFAYRLGPDGPERLDALDPPVGVTRRQEFGETGVPWRAGEDFLFLFTDGLVEGQDAPSEEALLDAANRATREGADQVLAAVFRLAAPDDPDDRTALVVRM